METPSIEIIESNKMIAEFMGYEKGVRTEAFLVPYFSSINKDKNREVYENEMQFNYRWDWLMPVVEKIETLPITVPEKYRIGFMKNTPISYVSIHTFYDEREEFKGWTSYLAFNAGNTIKDNSQIFQTKIGCYYKAVVEFIKWQNQLTNTSTQ